MISAFFVLIRGYRRRPRDVAAKIDPAVCAFRLDHIHQNGTEPI
jgi:hypothetical protein